MFRRTATLGRWRRAACRRIEVLKVCEHLDGVVGLLPGLGLEFSGELGQIGLEESIQDGNWKGNTSMLEIWSLKYIGE